MVGVLDRLDPADPLRLCIAHDVQEQRPAHASRLGVLTRGHGDFGTRPVGIGGEHGGCQQGPVIPVECQERDRAPVIDAGHHRELLVPDSRHSA